MSKKSMILLAACTVASAFMPHLAIAAEPPAEPQTIDLAEGHLQLPVPAAWKQVKPRNRIIKHEFSISALGDDKRPGRMTIMAASGGLEANIARWVGQFKSSEGKPLPAEAKKIEKKKVSGLEVHLVDLTGDFQDKPGGPFGPSVNRPNYRMLAAIIPTKTRGTWFIKFYGPRDTINVANPGFNKMIEGVVWKE